MLTRPPFYFPLRHGRYDVAPGLTKFGRQPTSSPADAHVFQLDSEFARFRAVKESSTESMTEQYVCARDLRRPHAAEAVEFIVRRLTAEHPDHFVIENRTLECRLTGDRISLSADPVATLDLLGLQVQEDYAIVSTSGDRHWLSYTHVCLPNGWAPAEKVGGSFAAVHEPVAGMAEMNRRGAEFATIMVRATEGLVRFAWGVTFDDELNHHPARPRTPFDPQHPRAFLRVERQTVWGFPRVGAALFTIRTYLYDCDAMRRDPATRDPLVAALRTMPQPSLEYKGLAPFRNDLVRWLTAGG